MKRILILILIIFLLSFCNKIKVKQIKLQKKKLEDTLTVSEQQGLRQIKFLDSLHRIGEF